MTTLNLTPRITYNDKGEKIVEYSDGSNLPPSAKATRTVKSAGGKAKGMIADLRRKNAAFTPDVWTILEMALATTFALEDRVKELEGRREKSLADAYKGTHLKNGEYSRSDLVTHDGSLWMALAPTKESPGSSPDWKLIVKGAR